jgi:hypothetical protein
LFCFVLFLFFLSDCVSSAAADAVLLSLSASI